MLGLLRRGYLGMAHRYHVTNRCQVIDKPGGLCSMDMLDTGMIHILGRTERVLIRFHHAAQNSMQFKT